MAADRFQAIVLTSFGAAALLLALLGIYGVLAYSVSLRRHEFGIRIALGSGKGALVRLVVRQAAYPVLLGTGAGLAMGHLRFGHGGPGIRICGADRAQRGRSWAGEAAATRRAWLAVA